MREADTLHGATLAYDSNPYVPQACDLTAVEEASHAPAAVLVAAEPPAAAAPAAPPPAAAAAVAAAAPQKPEVAAAAAAAAAFWAVVAAAAAEAAPALSGQPQLVTGADVRWEGLSAGKLPQPALLLMYERMPVDQACCLWHGSEAVVAHQMSQGRRRQRMTQQRRRCRQPMPQTRQQQRRQLQSLHSVSSDRQCYLWCNIFVIVVGKRQNLHQQHGMSH